MIPKYLEGLIFPSDVQEVCRRVDDLVTIANPHKNAQRRIRDLMDGGTKGMEALVGPAGRADMNVLNDLPAGNPLLSGLTALSTKLQQIPDLSELDAVTRSAGDRDTESDRRRSVNRETVIRHLDRVSRLKLQMPQVGMWLPGYGYAAWVLNERRDPDGQRYPHMELRDPLETYPGTFGVDQQPEDVAFIRHISTKTLVKMYPEYTRVLLQIGQQSGGSMVFDDAASKWSTQSAGIRVAEYYDDRGCWWVVPERNLCLEFRPNLLSRPQFVIPKRYSFHEMQGQYDHVIGLMAMTARLTVMQAQWIQDNVHGETNIYGQAPAEYRKGRFAINEFDPGTRVERVTNQMPFQVFQAIDRLERQLRTTARYPVTDDAQSPAAWATGAGLQELGTSVSLEVRTYQTQLQYALEDMDSMRLEWLERNYPGQMQFTVPGRRPFNPSTTIDGNYATERKYGMMAGWDESQKLVGGLQLVAAGIIPKRIMRENLEGLSDESSVRIDTLLNTERAEDVLGDALLQMAQQGDPRAVAAAIEMLPEGERKKVLTKFFIPEEEPVVAEGPALPEQPPGIEELFANPQMMARMSQSGNPNSGGVQVMGEIER